MIEITMEMNIPDLSKFTFRNSFEKIAKALEISIKKNFQDGGRPEKWTPKKNGQPSHLFLTGALFNSMGSESGEDYAEAGAMTLLPYSLIHQNGFDGVTSDGRNMHMPERHYVMFQEEDIEMCLRELAGSIVTFWNEYGERTTYNN